MIQLKDFIRESLVQIVEGVKEAQTEVASKKLGGRISPRRGTMNLPTDAEVAGMSVIQHVSFDIAVTVVEGDEKKVGGSFFIAPLGIGAAKTDTTKSENFSRLNFKVPMVLPEA